MFMQGARLIWVSDGFHVPSKTQTLLLSKGLSFVPTAPDAEPIELVNDFNKFTRKVKNDYNKTINPPRTHRPKTVVDNNTNSEY